MWFGAALGKGSPFFILVLWLLYKFHFLNWSILVSIFHFLFLEDSNERRSTSLACGRMMGGYHSTRRGHTDRVYVDFSNMKTVDADVEIYSVIGQLLHRSAYGASSVYTANIPNPEASFVVVKVRNGDRTEIKKLFISNTR